MRILLIVPPEREDFYNYLSNDSETEFLLLWSEKKEKSQLRTGFIKKEYYWNSYSTPVSLINSIMPDKIVFFEIIDQRQIALLVTANSLGLTTFYLEHGAAADIETAIECSNPTLSFYKKKGSYVVNRLFFSIASVLKTKYFYFWATRFITSRGSRIKYISLPFLMQFTTPNKALQKFTFPERVPKHAITFNKGNFEQYQLITTATPESAHFTGIPMFDIFYGKKVTEEKNIVVYIEHPYLEEEMVGWDAHHHKKIALALCRFANELSTPLIIKLHPRSDIKRWQSYKLQSSYLKIVQHEDITETYLSAKVILGYSSSLITGLLCAHKNIVLLGWHPQPRIFGTDFSKTGLCHISMSVDDIFSRLTSWKAENLTLKHPDLYVDFIDRHNSPFDGLATSRVLQTIRSL